MKEKDQPIKPPVPTPRERERKRKEYHGEKKDDILGRCYISYPFLLKNAWC
jgi:hypothetical protein